MIRALAHLFGWHTNACRGDLRCAPGPRTRLASNGWWRNLPTCSDPTCPEEHP